MTNQPEALRLADVLDRYYEDRGPADEKKASAELRRLHALNQELLEALKETTDKMIHWGDYASGYFQEKYDFEGDIKKARAAIAKATGEKQ